MRPTIAARQTPTPTTERRPRLAECGAVPDGPDTAASLTRLQFNRVLYRARERFRELWLTSTTRETS